MTAASRFSVGVEVKNACSSEEEQALSANVNSNEVETTRFDTVQKFTD